MARLLRVRHRLEGSRNAKLLAQLERERGLDMGALATSKLPLDPVALRGLPAIGGRGSIGGAIRGSRPGVR